MLIVENEYWILKSNAEFRYLNNVCWKFNNECLKRILNIVKRMLYVDMLNFEKKKRTRKRDILNSNVKERNSEYWIECWFLKTNVEYWILNDEKRMMNI